MRTKLQANPVAVQLPIVTEDGFIGVIDLVSMKAVRYKDETLGAQMIIEEIPEVCRAEAMALRDRLIEKVSEVSDDLLSKHLHGEPLADDEIRAVLRRRTIDSVRTEDVPFVPVLCGAAFKNKGVQPLLDAVVDYLPSPEDVPPISGLDPRKKDDTLVERAADDNEPFAALVFKVMTESATLGA